MEKAQLRPLGTTVCIDYPPSDFYGEPLRATRWHYVVSDHVQLGPSRWAERLIPTHKESIPLAESKCSVSLTYRMSEVFTTP